MHFQFIFNLQWVYQDVTPLCVKEDLPVNISSSSVGAFSCQWLLLCFAAAFLFVVVPLSCFFYVCLFLLLGAFGVTSMKSLSKPTFWTFVPVLSSWSFTMWGLLFKSLIDWVIVRLWCTVGSKLVVFQVQLQFPGIVRCGDRPFPVCVPGALGRSVCCLCVLVFWALCAVPLVCVSLLPVAHFQWLLLCTVRWSQDVWRVHRHCLSGLMTLAYKLLHCPSVQLSLF